MTNALAYNFAVLIATVKSLIKNSTRVGFSLNHKY
jgi:hypothetical protein